MFRILPMILGLIILILSSSAFARGQITIDALIVYSPQAERYLGKRTLISKIDRQIREANGAFRRSNLKIRIRPIGQPFKVSIESGMMSRTLKNSKNNFQIIREKKKRNADIALIFTAEKGHGGAATIPRGYNKDTNTNVVMSIRNIKKYNTIHEVGHLLGLGHSVRNKNGRRYKYDSYGYGVDGDFVTIMAYSSRYKNALKIGVFSSPNVRLCRRQACGITGYADAVLTINITAKKLTNISNISTSGNISVAKKKAQKKYNAARSAYRKSYYVYKKAYNNYKRRKISYYAYIKIRSKYSMAITKYIQAKNELRKYR